MLVLLKDDCQDTDRGVRREILVVLFDRHYQIQAKTRRCRDRSGDADFTYSLTPLTYSK